MPVRGSRFSDAERKLVKDAMKSKSKRKTGSRISDAERKRIKKMSKKRKKK